jgi:hypothetical protein
MTKKPYLIDGIVLYAGYLYALIKRVERPVSAKLMRFHRQEEMQKLKSILISLAKFTTVDNFELRKK